MEMNKKTDALAVTLAEEKAMSEVFMNSGLFPDTKSRDQAIVKILAGREIGLQPIESMTGLNIFSGKITIGGNVMASKVMASTKYRYRIVKIDDEECSIDFFEGKDKLGNSTFSMKDAKNAGLDRKDNWVKWRRNMMFNRALSNGVRWYCPDVFGSSPIYTPDELGVLVDEDDKPIDITPKESTIVEHAKRIEDEETEEPEPTPELKVIPNDPLPSTKKPRGRPKADTTQHYNPETQDNPHESESEAEPEQVKEGTQEAPKFKCDLQLIPTVVERMKASESPRNAFKIMEKHALQGQGHHLRALVREFCPEFFDRGFSVDQIPESALIAMIQSATGLKLKAVEKTHKCKTKGCKNTITEPEKDLHKGVCWECFAKESED